MERRARSERGLDMTTASVSPLLRHIQKLTASCGVQEWTDRQLLEGFAARGDEAAFTALVYRHGPMVLRVCRRVLHHEQDAEDAFQATFLVLARNYRSIQNRDTVSDWLYGVAYRTAMKAKRSAGRRRKHEAKLTAVAPQTAIPTWDDVQAVLDEEIQRLPPCFRQAFVLCQLEGKSGPEAALELGCKEGTVKSRLNRARRLLRHQLARRGIQLTALLAGLSIAESNGRAALPTPLARVTIRSGLLVAAGEPAAGLIPSHVNALATGVTRAMFLTRAKLSTALLLAASLLVLGAAALARQVPAGSKLPAGGASLGGNIQTPSLSPQKAAVEKNDRIEVRGCVVDPEGKPFAGAKLYLNYHHSTAEDRPLRATSTANGHFTFAFKRSLLDESSPYTSWFQVIAVAEGYGPDWAYQDKPVARVEWTLSLVKDVPIRGRILDVNGKPVKSATLRVEHIDAYANTEAFLQTVRERGWPLVDSKGWSGPLPGQPQTLTTGTDGGFQLAGVGKDRLISFQVEGPGIQWGPLRALGRAMKAPVEPSRPNGPAQGPVIHAVYPATFDYVVQPSRLIRGVVRDKKTGQPVGGAGVSASGTTDRASTDERGRFELRGFGKRAEGYGLVVSPASPQYFSRSVTFPDTLGLGPIESDIELVRGILVKGQITHQVTGKPIAGARVHYNPIVPNPFVRLFGPNGAGVSPCSWASTGSDGSYSLVVLPGPGVLGFLASSPKETFMPALVTTQELKAFFKDEADHGDEDTLKVQAGINSWSVVGQAQYNHLLLLNLGEKEETLTRDVALRPARPLRGKVVGADRKRLAGVTAFNLAPGVLSQPLAEDTFTVEGLNPQRTRHLVFLDKGRKHGAFVSITGEVKEPLTVRLQECGSVAGRLLDQDGQPARGAMVRLDPEALLDSAPAKVKTDSEGRFRIDGLVPGQKYQARLGLPPFGQYLFTPFTLETGQSKDLGECQLKPRQ
jgi:RNA polymerase sigma factor (sigma-70 family)